MICVIGWMATVQAATAAAAAPCIRSQSGLRLDLRLGRPRMVASRTRAASRAYQPLSVQSLEWWTRVTRWSLGDLGPTWMGG